MDISQPPWGDIIVVKVELIKQQSTKMGTELGDLVTLREENGEDTADGIGSDREIEE